jgi:hypothetical protein
MPNHIIKVADTCNEIGNFASNYTDMEKINGKVVNRSFTYQEYRNHIDNLFEQGKTTGENQSESMLHYTKMNIQRMKRWEKKFEIGEELKAKLESLETPQTWVVYTEAWCGDAAQNIPLLHLAAQGSDKINFMVLLRDENTETMNDYLTNGGMSIPKLVIFEGEKELGTWGPRPAPLQQMVMDNKHSETPLPYDEFSVIVQKWYNSDKGATFQEEIMQMLDSPVLSST